MKSQFKDLKFGVFTRSPRSYALNVLRWAYPQFVWDIVIAYEDVAKTKPSGDGIDKAMETFGVTRLDRVLLVGDSDVDVRAGYNCGCRVVLDKGAWPFKKGQDHWRALEHIPDAIIESPSALLEVLADPDSFLPELERLLVADAPATRQRRFDKINHFIARAAGGDTTPYPIHIGGRSFANYPSVKWRKKWHILSESIEENKESETFPAEWIKAIRIFISSNFISFSGNTNVVVTVVPHRPGRTARLENLVLQLQKSIDETPIKARTVVCQPSLLAYKSGVKSQHNDLLNRDERCINVRDHLFVVDETKVSRSDSYLVLDDVTTTGASLIYAYKYLKEAGAVNVKCLSMAKNIGDVL